ncbi:hypothetical protein INT45_000464 [Circinella minor]|uniref:Uncharacterized protein n=1 Tax=Circinella minor TaxID=1195481 RepID=A0A8H7VQ23_9FUNG|nr:hypothetical protein INT45_000464 [Circinella minor]
MLDKTVAKETELWSSVFDSILSLIISDLEKKLCCIGSVSEFLQAHPDALICEVNQLGWGWSIGFGEIKLADSTPNLDLLGHHITP